MKKGLTSKVLLSVATLGLAIASFGTTTYAWFTMNTTATASGVQGTTESDQGNFFVSLDNVKWGTSVAIPAITDKIKPVSKGASSYYYLNNTGVWTAAVAGADYYEFSIFYKANMAGTVTATPTWVSTGMAEFKPLVTIDTTADDQDSNAELVAGRPVKLDILQAMRISTQVGGATATSHIVNPVQSDAHAQYGNASETGIAALYYKALMGEFPTADKPAVQDETNIAAYDVETYTLAANTALEVKYVIWLEGWDADCFNAITAQNFSLTYAFNFTKTA